MPTRPLLLCCALLSAAATLGGCKTRELHPSADAGPTGWTGALDPLHLNNVDILFVIDDSSDMALAQDNLIRNFPTFMATLQADPSGPRNVRIAVVSQDMGADGSIPGCDSVGGKKGVFQYTARGTCSASNLMNGATYIMDSAGQTNFTGNVEDVFGCIAALGNSGCGLNHPFAATLRALGADGHPVPAENQAFLRPDAALAIVMLTSEDDCSASPGVPLFDTGSNMNLGSQLGPPTHFRCNEFGHLCPAGPGGTHPIRYAPSNDVNATVNYDTCVSNDAEGYLLSTKDTADRIKFLKADPSRIVVASIQGSPTPYAVHWRTPPLPDTSCGAASCPWPEVTHACTAPDGRYGDPGVRTAQFAHEFGDNGLVLSVCDGSFGPGLNRLAETINRVVGPSCLPGPVALDAAGLPACTVKLRDGIVGPAAVPSCVASAGALPCWQLVSEPSCSSGQALDVSVDPSTSSVYSSVIATYDCAKGAG